ncbi:MAG: tetratricopeptide repeat protein, partial [Kiritimatiellae bacterium]|nr:tetratricopeptide repeat protein [Kiritimatiellia bacterium]
QEYRNTPTWPRAIMAGFMIYQNKGQDDKALAALKDVHRRFPDTEWGKRAYYHQGEFLYAKGQKKESQKIFAACQKKYTDTWLARGASQYLEKIKAGEK